MATLAAALLHAGPANAERSCPGPLAGPCDAIDTSLADLRAELPEWTRRFRLSGNADAEVISGERHSPAPGAILFGDNARLFLDVDLVERAGLADVSAFVEWDAVREREVQNTVGSLYLRFDRLIGVEALNFKVGRVLIPYGEEYLRFSEQRPLNPLVSFSAPAPYGWDDGFLFFGPLGWKNLSYVAGLLTNSHDLDLRLEGQPELTGKLMWHPTPWVDLSVSGLRTGPLGSPRRPGEAALEFAATEIAPFGDDADEPSFDHGRPLAPDPSGRVSMVAGEADAIFTPAAGTRLWLAYGHVVLEGGTTRYDRTLQYGIAEGILDLDRFWRRLDRFYGAARWSTFGTFDQNEGYRIDTMNGGEELGFNTQSVDMVTVGGGYRFSDHLTFKLEYTWTDFDLVRGVPADLRAEARGRDYFAVGVSLGF